jgi:predicted nucleic acid-binding protein
MIVLDTNVVSEPLKAAASPAVIAWLDRQNIETLFLSAISLAELRYGVAALPGGRRKDGLRTALEERIFSLFGSRILAFDTAAADAYAAIRARAKAAGKIIGASDGYIAATAAAHGLP